MRTVELLLRESAGDMLEWTSSLYRQYPVYGADVRSYLLVECADLLPIDRGQVRSEASALTQARFAECTAIPF